MTSYAKPVEIRWSDLDPNFHLRHSVYYDFGAYLRVCCLSENGLGPDVLMKNHLGPILFREECVFKREIVFGDMVTINLAVKQSLPDCRRWTMQHEIVKNGAIVSAVITVDGAWMDTQKRKLTSPPDFIIQTFDQLPRTPDFVWLQPKEKNITD